MNKNLIGQRFNKLVVLEDSGLRNTDGTIKWHCKCDCGNYNNVNTTNLLRGITKSCGCLRKEAIRKAKKKYNTFTIDGDICYCTDSKGLTFIIDKEDYNKIKEICWVVDEHDGRVSGLHHGKLIRLHRYILDIDSDDIIDHINHNPSDNRKCNLRIANKSQNAINRPKNKNNTTGYKGVTKLKNGKYMARIVVNYKGIYLGCFDTPEEAYTAYKQAEEKYFGEYAYKGGEINE